MWYNILLISKIENGSNTIFLAYLFQNYELLKCMQTNVHLNPNIWSEAFIYYTNTNIY